MSCLSFMRVAMIVVGLVVTLLAIAFYLGQGRVTVRIREADAQSLIDAKLPLKSRSPHHAYELTQVKLAFLDGNKVHVDCQLALEFVGRKAEGAVSGTARPVYRDGKFFLEDFQVEKLDLGRLELAPTDRPIRERTMRMLAEGFLSSVPIYEVKSWKRLVLREVRVEKGSLIAVLDPTTSWKLSSIPSSPALAQLSVPSFFLARPAAPSPSRAKL